MLTIDWTTLFDSASALHYSMASVVVLLQTIDLHWQQWQLRLILHSHVMVAHLLVEWFYWREHWILQRLSWRISMDNHCKKEMVYISIFSNSLGSLILFLPSICHWRRFICAEYIEWKENSENASTEMNEYENEEI